MQRLSAIDTDTHAHEWNVWHVCITEFWNYLKLLGATGLWALLISSSGRARIMIRHHHSLPYLVKRHRHTLLTIFGLIPLRRPPRSPNLSGLPTISAIWKNKTHTKTQNDDVKIGNLKERDRFHISTVVRAARRGPSGSVSAHSSFPPSSTLDFFILPPHSISVSNSLCRCLRLRLPLLHWSLFQGETGGRSPFFIWPF